MTNSTLAAEAATAASGGRLVIAALVGIAGVPVTDAVTSFSRASATPRRVSVR